MLLRMVRWLVFTFVLLGVLVGAALMYAQRTLNMPGPLETTRNVVVPRQIAMYLAKQMTEASLPEIGRQFGNKHHTTVMHSIAKIDELRRTDKDLHRTLNKLQEQLNG